MSKTSYWDKRKVERYLEAEKIEKQYKKKIQSIYKQAYKNIDEELRSIYKNYSNQTGLDQQQLKQILTKSETKKTFEELKKQGLDKYVLENYKARINRLEQIQAQMYAKAKKIYPSEAELQKECFTDVMRDGYYRTIYDIEKGTGNMFQFSAIDDNTITRLLNDRWSGENYSTRIWTNTDILADNLQEIIGGGLLSGQSYAKISRQIRDRFNVAKYYSDRLARTEVNYFNNQVDALANQELGFDKYVIVATLDKKTSDICQDMDGKVFEYSKMEVGDNYPPFHPNCRTTVRAYLGEFEKNIKRTAIDPTTNERVEIDNISYQEWYNNNVNKYGKDKIETSYKKVKNTNIDKEQYSRYKKVLGMENVPSNLEKWQEMKYNKPNEWKHLKKDYYTVNNNRFMQEKLDFINSLTDEKEFIPQNTVFNKVGVLFKGNEIDDIKRLQNLYGGKTEEWNKMYANIETDKYKLIQVHYYYKNNTQYEMKLKTMKYNEGVIKDD